MFELIRSRISLSVSLLLSGMRIEGGQPHANARSVTTCYTDATKNTRVAESWLSLTYSGLVLEIAIPGSGSRDPGGISIPIPIPKSRQSRDPESGQILTKIANIDQLILHESCTNCTKYV